VGLGRFGNVAQISGGQIAKPARPSAPAINSDKGGFPLVIADLAVGLMPVLPAPESQHLGVRSQVIHRSVRINDYRNAL
jgi:hypothetical protein